VKVEAFLQKQIATKPELVQISTAYGQQQEGSKIITRSKYVEIKSEKPDTPEKAKWPEFKTCKYTTEAIVSEGIDKGQLRNVCTQPDCTIHHPKKQSTKADASFKAEQDKSRREQALANATGMRVLQTIVAAVPVRLMKRDFLFIAEQMLPLLDDKRLEMVARNRGIRANEGESAGKLLTAFLRKAEEGVIGKVIVEAVILLSASKQADGGKILRAAAQAYKVDTDAIALKVRHEFAAKEKARSAAKIEPKPAPKALKKSA
jgi:ParB family chromosome partitioning protein